VTAEKGKDISFVVFLIVSLPATIKEPVLFEAVILVD
jgi:hypothetical protein